MGVLHPEQKTVLEEKAMTFDPYDNSCKQIHDQYMRNKAAKQQPMNLLDDIHTALAKSSLPMEEYQPISRMIISLKNLLQ